MYDDILKRIFPSKDMSNYLIKRGLDNSVDCIEDLIFRAPVSIYLKKQVLVEIKRDMEENIIRHSIQNLCNVQTEIDYQRRMRKIENYEGILHMAMFHMGGDGVYVIETANYNTVNNICNLQFECVMATFSQTKEWIEDQLVIEQYDKDVPHWNRVTKYVKDSDGKYIETCTYIFVGNEVWSVDLSDEYAVQEGLESEWNYEINVEVPFRAGDIIEINGLPFSPKYHALITNVGDNRDCCCLQALVRRPDGGWEVGSVKHNQLIYNTYPFVSPLYTATYIKGKLLPGEELMFEVQKCINGDEQRGAKLWDYVSYKARTELEIKDFLYSIEC